MRALVLSGGGAKGAFTAGVVKYLLRDRGMSFDLAVGTSTGSLIGGPALLGDYNYLGNVYTGVRNRDIYKNSVLGWLLNRLGLLSGPFQADLSPLHQMLKEYYLTRGKLDQLLASGKTLVVTTVNVRTGKLHYCSSEAVKTGEIAPETFVRAILGSSVQPVFTRPVCMYETESQSPYRSDLFYDGGVREFIPLEEAVLQGATEIWAVSTHPLREEETGWGKGTPPKKVNPLKALGWTLKMLVDEVARGDRFRADLYLRWARAREIIREKARHLGVPEERLEELLELPPEADPAGLTLPRLYLIYPYYKMGASLEFDPVEMFDYFVNGQLAAERFFELGAPPYTDQTLRPWLTREENP